MTVQEVFELRREGRIEEAYNAILPMYKIHHGKYTTIAMFWCAADRMSQLLEMVSENDEESNSAYNEAERIYRSLQILYPNMHDEEGYGKYKMDCLQKQLDEAKSILDGTYTPYQGHIDGDEIDGQ